MVTFTRGWFRLEGASHPQKRAQTPAGEWDADAQGWRCADLTKNEDFNDDRKASAIAGESVCVPCGGCRGGAMRVERTPGARKLRWPVSRSGCPIVRPQIAISLAAGLPQV